MLCQPPRKRQRDGVDVDGVPSALLVAATLERGFLFVPLPRGVTTPRLLPAVATGETGGEWKEECVGDAMPEGDNEDEGVSDGAGGVEAGPEDNEDSGVSKNADPGGGAESTDQCFCCSALGSGLASRDRGVCGGNRDDDGRGEDGVRGTLS